MYIYKLQEVDLLQIQSKDKRCHCELVPQGSGKLPKKDRVSFAYAVLILQLKDSRKLPVLGFIHWGLNPGK
jgi:hypothetical protein